MESIMKFHINDIMMLMQTVVYIEECLTAIRTIIIINKLLEFIMKN
jgi:hypothetical protein